MKDLGECKLMGKYNPLRIGDLVVKNPVIQGGMGVGISLSGLAGAVAKAGGIGIISTAQIGFQDPQFEADPEKANLSAIITELKKARKIAESNISGLKPVLGFNIMVATKNYAKYARTAAQAGADIIISGAGLPINLPEYVKGSRTKIAPIVSSAKSASVICRMWDRKYHRSPDMVVIEGPLAGGHLGFSREDLIEYGADTADVPSTYRQASYDEEIHKIKEVISQYEKKYNCKIPVVSAGGVFSREDMEHHMGLGVDGVQVGTRFVTTRECDAPLSYKQSYINAKKKDIIIVKSPVGMPGRAIKNPFMEKVLREKEKISHCFCCLEHCNPAEIPYCITKALIRAAKGQVEDALLFCGANAYRCHRIETVEEVMADLCEE